MAIRAIGYLFFLLTWVDAVTVVAAQSFLPDGSLKPGVRITIPAGEERELLFRPEGVRFLAGKARLRSVSGPLIDPYGQETKEIVIDADDKTQGVPWMHDEKPFRLRIRAITEFTLETRQSWEWDPEKDLPKPHSL